MITATPNDIAALSRTLLDRELHHDAELSVIISNGAGKIGGSWPIDAECKYRRGSGGSTWELDEGTVYIGLALSRSNAIVADCDPTRIVNRHVRPLLAALRARRLQAMYGGRDFLSSKGVPIAWVGFQHSVENGRAAFEAVLGTKAPFESPGRASLMGKTPSAIDVAAELLASTTEKAFLVPTTSLLAASKLEASAIAIDGELAIEEDAIGRVGAWMDGDRVRIGGDFQASREFVPLAEAALYGVASEEEGRARLEALLAESKIVVVGLKSVDSLARAAWRAISQNRP